ncbi:MAG TPA: hypothetical protein VM286_02300 [Candidatus Thermoplasmatota archaeon]|nr:hypothetical protein [Candidatus Thermoplasmatota archaeon]
MKAILLTATLGVLVLASLPVSANHVQTGATGATTIQFDHDGDNEYWVEVLVRAGPGDFVTTVQARAEGGMWHYLQHKATLGDWHKWGTNTADQFRIAPGQRVQFRADVMDDARQATDVITSCPFTHPAGVEQCSSTSPQPTSGFDATFTGFRGNEYWVQANVATNGPAIVRVDVHLDNGAWMPLTKQSWGGWAASYHITQGTIVQMRATASDGRTDLSSCRQWIPPSGQDARIVSCGTTAPPPPQSSTMTFTGVKGNNYWLEVVIKGDKPIYPAWVYFNDCTGDPHDLTYHADWGKWTLGTYIPTGTKVIIEAFYEGHDPQRSGGYIWPNATPTSGC